MSTSNQQRRNAVKAAAKRDAQSRPGGESNYARKSKWLHKHAMWGFDVPEPKPWKRKGD